jgi:hypothetical protein
MSLHQKLAALACLWLIPLLSHADLPDYSTPGPLRVISGEYRLPASVDPLVTPDRVTEVWAVVFRPARTPAKPYPLVVFLHGNHGTCGRYDADRGIRVDDDATYTETGQCPSGYTVTPNHRGYDYLAKRLASWGYVVVSINANRGITADYGTDNDWGLNLRRGRMVLRHLAYLAQWNNGEAATPASLKFSLANTLDFSEVGLMGHSRGGEGMRGAWEQYLDKDSPFRKAIHKPLTVRSIFEIAPVDGQTSRELNANKAASMILLANCDGDVSDLQGVHVFDRALLKYMDGPVAANPRPKNRGTFNVLGGNHNFFNTEWQESDSYSCPGHARLFPDYGGSAQQRVAALNSLVPFFLGTVGKKRDSALLNVFDPQTPISGPLLDVGGLERGFVYSNYPQNRLVLEQFKATKPESDDGIPHTLRKLSVIHTQAPYEHDYRLKVARIEWPSQNGGGTQVPQIDIALAKPTAPLDMQAFKYLGLRLTTACLKTTCQNDWEQTPKVDASLTLLDADGKASSPAISLADISELRRPVGSSFWGPTDLHSILQHGYLPMAAISGIDKSRIAKLRITFDRTAVGSLLINEISAQNDPFNLSPAASSVATSEPMPETATVAEQLGWQALATDSRLTTAQADQNQVIAVSRRDVAAATSASAAQAVDSYVDVVLASSRRFPVTDSLPQAQLGALRSVRVRLATDGKQLTASFKASEYDAQASNANLQIHIGNQPAWDFGVKP